MCVLGCVAHGFVGVSAGAAPMATLDLKERLGDWMPWSDAIPFSPFQRYEFALFVSHTEGVALSDVRFNITSDDNLPAGSTVHLSGPGLGDQAPFDQAFEANTVFWSGDAFRIDEASDAANNPSVGVRVAQRPPILAGSDFSTANPAMVMRFDLTTGVSQPDLISLITPGEASGRVFTSTLSTGMPVFISAFEYDGAYMFLPAPSAAPCLFVGALAMRRRR